MPLFDFICKKCGTQSELLVRNGETPRCPKCGSKQLERQLAHFNAIAATSAPKESVGCGLPNCCRAQGGCGLPE
jgi:putative FmdB family regulatory protein